MQQSIERHNEAGESKMSFEKGEFILEVSNESNSARIIKVSESTHTIIAMVTIPTGKTKELLLLTTLDATRKKWRLLLPDSVELYGFLPVVKWNLKKLKE
jgi:hypothetical protein